jgi:hypothetical protein
LMRVTSTLPFAALTQHTMTGNGMTWNDFWFALSVVWLVVLICTIFLVLLRLT